MNYKWILTLLTTLGLTAGSFAAPDTKPQVGVVNLMNCMNDSKYGKQEQSSLEALKKQLASLLEDTEKQLNEIGAKFNDSEYMDGLSPEAEEEMKNKFRALNEEMNRYQNQYYQVLNQAQMKVFQSVYSKIQNASEKVAKDKRLTMVINKEACFFHNPVLDVTNNVVTEMDKEFDLEAAKKPEAVAQAAPSDTKVDGESAQ